MTIAERKQALETKFADTQERANNLQAQLNNENDELKRLQGEYRLLTDMEADDPNKVDVEPTLKAEDLKRGK